MISTIPVVIVKLSAGYSAQYPTPQVRYAQDAVHEAATESIRDAPALPIEDRLAETLDVCAHFAVSATALQAAARRCHYSVSAGEIMRVLIELG